MNVLVVAAHPDDEVLGCGGTIARHAAAGHTVDILFVADGETARGTASASGMAQRRQAAEGAARVLGSNPPTFLDLPDNRLDSVPLLDIVQRIEQNTERLSPNVVYTHHMGDLNVDHEIVCRAVLTAFRPLPDTSVRAIYGFEVLSSTGWKGSLTPFEPCRLVDVSTVLAMKLEALACYASEMRPFPHARSGAAVEALAHMRGAIHGLTAAEAFVVYRQIAEFPA